MAKPSSRVLQRYRIQEALLKVLDSCHIYLAERIQNIMWSDFSDYELAELAGRYGLEDNLVFDYELSLANRDEIEKLLTEFEWEIVNAERSI